MADEHDDDLPPTVEQRNDFEVEGFPGPDEDVDAEKDEADEDTADEDVPDDDIVGK